MTNEEIISKVETICGVLPGADIRQLPTIEMVGL